MRSVRGHAPNVLPERPRGPLEAGHDNCLGSAHRACVFSAHPRFEERCLRILDICRGLCRLVRVHDLYVHQAYSRTDSLFLVPR